jgi:hypothetical protein
MPRKPQPRIRRICETCGAEFYVTQARLNAYPAKYCSLICRDAAHQTTVICKQCGKEFTLNKSRIHGNRGQLCSPECQRLYLTGRAKRKHVPTREDFEAYMRESFVVNHQSDCWEWTKACTDHGYARASVGGKRYRASRIAAWLWLGFDLNSGLDVMHTCDNPKCVNPAHLIPAPTKENVIDMYRKERSNHQKMSVEKVQEFRHLRDAGHTTRSLAKRFGLNESWAGHIARGEAWAHVEAVST